MLDYHLEKENCLVSRYIYININYKISIKRLIPKF